MNKNVAFVRFDPIADGDKTLTDVLGGIVRQCKNENACAAVFQYSDCPFLNRELTERLIDSHFRYSAEYTYADGYPYGLAPEVIDAGTAGILEKLSRTAQAKPGGGQAVAASKMTRTAIWDLIKTDINSYEVETIIAPKDYRLWRLAFHTGNKAQAMSCTALQKALGKRDASEVQLMNAYDVCETAIKNISVVRTVPCFYQVETKGMPLDKFSVLARQMKELSGEAVVSIPEADVQKAAELAHAGLDILVETDEVLTDDVCAKCKALDPAIKWIVKNPSDGNVSMLEKYFPGAVYPQLVRTLESEPLLEAFYRKWSALDSPSLGKVLITKYCSYCGTLSDEKPCDLSPLERNPCWHLRRDMAILKDGTVPLCFARINSLDDKNNILGNAFSSGLAALWQKMEEAAKRDLLSCEKDSGEVMDDLCRKCDEYYTFNF